jgi:hypothetical protein
MSFEPLPKDDLKQRCPGMARARTWLGWELQVRLNVGLAKTVEYYRELLSKAEQSGCCIAWSRARMFCFVTWKGLAKQTTDDGSGADERAI